MEKFTSESNSEMLNLLNMNLSMTELHGFR